MNAVTSGPPRIATLDILRGVAVMGILAMNIVAFAMPFQAYMNPMAYGAESNADLVSWVFSFIFIDGKMRGLFSFLFGASMLLVIERAEAGGLDSAQVHFRRMAWLLLFGLVHFYLIWFGDILSLYAMIGMIAWFFHAKGPRALIRWGIGLVLVQFLLFAGMGIGLHMASAGASAPGASAEAVRTWAQMSADFSVPSAAETAKTLSLYRGSYGGILGHQIGEELWTPLASFFLFGSETLGYMLIGMACLKTGFFTGSWPAERYRKVALAGFSIGIPVYALLAWLVWSSGFSVLMIFDILFTASTLVRPIMIVATAALVILLTRKGGALVDRVAAAGRAAFTNYLGTSLVMTSLFYGYGVGLFGALSRAELWLVVLPAWALMLLWSKPWLGRYRYGPFEWLWRTLSRWEVQPMRRRVPAASAPSA